MRRGASRARAIVIALLCLLLLNPAPAQFELDTSRREALEAEIADYQELLEAREAEASAIEEALSQTSSNLQARIAERDEVSSQLAGLRSRHEALREEIRLLNEQLANTQERINGLLEDLEILKARISALLVNLYQQRAGRFAGILSQAESFHDLQVKNVYLSLLSQRDNQVVENLGATLDQLSLAQQQLRDQLATKEAAEAELVANEERLEEAEARLASIIAELESTRAGQMAQRQSLIEAQEEIEETLANLDQQLDDEIERLRAEEARLRREAAEAFLDERSRLLEQADELRQRRENLEMPLTAAPSGYVYPLAGHSILSEYGEDNNSYMALRAPVPNAAVVAVADGVVRGVAFLSANDGYMVSVAHSDRLSTVYTNLRPPIVQVGDRVTKGEVIGNLGGSTLVAPDVLKLWVQVTENGRSAFVDPAVALGF
ncbi:MAG TPA: peptidoglycan DD-metalloendopeptidase family protein [Trueperaceae bacterium]